MPDSLVDPAVSKVRKAIRLTLNDIGRRVRDDIKQSINVPVQYVGSETIRSDPGEPPRRETRRLWKSIKYRVFPKASTIEHLEIFTAEINAIRLEQGTRTIEPRPFWAPARKRISRYIKSAFRQGLKERLKEPGISPPTPGVD